MQFIIPFIFTQVFKIPCLASNKIFNDPIYGFISVPNGILMQVIEHRYFQRLRRIKQLGLTHYVYPGAVHTRFNHALGAYHLMTEALYHLQQKGHEISREEMEAAQLAILLHDIGHGPFSHVLEHSLVNVHHETITLWIMEALNKEFNGKLNLAIELFKGHHPKKFLHQLISSQLDVDRLDYLKRDSFYTGVVEGNIGIDRLIMMMDIVDNSLVLEEKAIYTIEKFLSSRRIMYLQVYLHKTAMVAEKMLKQLLQQISSQYENEISNFEIKELLQNKNSKLEQLDRNRFLELFSSLDDADIWSLLKHCKNHSNDLVSNLAVGLLDRILYKIDIKTEQNEKSMLQPHPILGQTFKVDFTAYDPAEGEIMIKRKNGAITALSEFNEFNYLMQNISRYYTIKS